MAKGESRGGVGSGRKLYKKGESGNPLGRPKLYKTPAQREFVSKTRTEVALRCLELMMLRQSEVKELIKQDLPLWERGVLSVASRAIADGDIMRLERLMIIAFGPQKQPIELTGSEGKPLIPRDPKLTGERLTQAILTVQEILRRKENGKT